MTEKRRKLTGQNFAAMMRSRHTGIAMSPDEWDQYLDNFDTIDDVKCAPNWTSRSAQGMKGEARGLSFDSKWEYVYYIWKKDIRGEYIERNNKGEDYLEYTDSTGKMRKFYPDFKTSDYPYTEIKGRWRDNDLCKMEQCPQVKFIDGVEMKPIIKEVYEKIPHWEEDYHEKISF